MPDFDRLYTHVCELAELLYPDRREPGLHTWCMAVGERWQAVADMWANQPELRETETEAAENLQPFPPDRELQRVFPSGQIERPEVINIDARYAVVHQREGDKPRTTMCANCGTRYELTDDPIENHHRAYAHKAQCRPAAGTLFGEEQQAYLVKEFQDQPMQREFAARAAAALEAGVSPETLRLTGVSLFGEHPKVTALRELGAAASAAVEQLVQERTAADLKAIFPPRRWWQFWRWFE